MAWPTLTPTFLVSYHLCCRLAESGAKGVDNCLRKFITCPPFFICQMKWDVKSEVENYLDKTFYDLCTLNLNDCNTYNEMRTIANERYGLKLIDPYLPDGSLDQGVDFIDILRDLNCELLIFSYTICKLLVEQLISCIFISIYSIHFPIQLQFD